MISLRPVSLSHLVCLNRTECHFGFVMPPALCEFWMQKQRLNHEEQENLSSSTVILLRQWDRLVENEILLYRQELRPNGAEAVLQMLLPCALISKVLTQVHQEHGHQGVDRTLALLWSRCYWPSMFSDLVMWPSVSGL